MDSESEHARRIVSAQVRDVLLAQPGIAAVEELHVKKRWGRTRGVTACVRIDGNVDVRDVCRRAAEALTRQLGVADVCLVAAAEPGETVPWGGAP